MMTDRDSRQGTSPGRPEAPGAALAGEHRFETVFHDHDAVMLLIDPATGRIIDANPAAAAFYGYTQAELRSMQITEINTMPAGEVAALLAQAESGRRGHFVFPHRLASGEIRRVAVHSSPIRDGRPLLLSIIVDIEDRVRLEEDLAAAEEESRLAFDRSSVATCLVSNDGRIIRANPAICDLLGRSAAELLTLSFLDVTHPDDAAEGADQLRDMLAGRRTSLRLIKRYVTGDGRTIHGDVTVSAVLDGEGRVRHRIAQILDVTDRVLAERALADSESLLSVVLDTSSDATMRLDRHLRVEYVNKRIVDVSGVPFEGWIGRTHTELGYPADLVRAWDAHSRRVFDTGEPVTYEFEIVNEEGRPLVRDAGDPGVRCRWVGGPRDRDQP